MRRRNKPPRQRFARDELPDDEMRIDPPKREDRLCGEITIRRFIGKSAMFRKYRLFESNRCDCYRVECNGELLEGRHGMSWVLAHARKDTLRVSGKRST